MTLAVQSLAERQWRDYQACTPGTYFGDAGPLDLDDAYRVQDAVTGLRLEAGDELLGFKVGCTGPGTVTQFGMAGPIRGTLFRSEQRRSGDAIDASAYASLAIEGEMAVRIGPDGLPADAFPVIELHNFVFRGARKTLAELVANNGLHAGTVLPELNDAARAHHRAGATMSVNVNGESLGQGELWPTAGGARASVDWLRAHLAAHGLALWPGALVLVGTALGLYRVQPGDHVVIDIDDHKAVECRIAQ